MMNWLRKLVGLGATAKNLTSLNEEERREETKAFIEKSNLELFQGHVQNLYSTQRIREISTCPRCEYETEKKAAIFVCATDTLSQIIISAENHFCTNCSSALIDDKLLQQNCEKGKVYRGIIGFFIRENIQTYQSLNEYIIRYHYDQNSKPSGIKITSEKINPYDSKLHGSKGTKSQYKIPSSPVTLMDRIERRDKRESLNDSRDFKSKKNSKSRSSQNDDSEPMTQEQKDKAARSERARIAIENVGKKRRSRGSKHKKKEEFADSVNETKQDFKDKVEQKSNFNPKKKQKPVVENPNAKQTKQERLDKLERKQLEAKHQEETKRLPTSKEQAPPARASQRKKQAVTSDKTPEKVHDKTNKENQNLVKASQNTESEASKTVVTESNQDDTATTKNRKYKHKRSTRKTRGNKRPTRKKVETQQVATENESKNESKNEPKNDSKVEAKKQKNAGQSTEAKVEQTKKLSSRPKQESPKRQKQVDQSKQNSESTPKSNGHQKGETKEQAKKESIVEKLHQNLQESSKASVLLKEEKQKEQQKESSRLARLKEEKKEEKVSRRKPRSNVRPPIDLDLKNVNPRRRYNNTKKK